jgi:hypothetical protein
MEIKVNRPKILRSLFVLSLLILFFFTIRKLNNPLNLDSSKFNVLSTSTYYSEAKAIAVEWEPDAYLASVSPTFSTIEDNDNSLSINYSFRSNSKPSKWLNVFYTASDDLQPKVSEGEFSEGNNRPLTLLIDINSLSVDSASAILIAYKNGGKDFILKHRGVDSNSFLQLEQENMALGTGRLVWQVTFSRDRLSMHIILDASTGEILEVLRNDE